MKTESVKFTAITCFLLTTTHTIFLFNPFNTLQMYSMVLRPMAYAALVIIIFVYMGLDSRPVRQGFLSNATAFFSVTAFGVVIVILSIIFSASANAVLSNTPFFIRSLWEVGWVLVLGEFIRYKLIKNTDYRHREWVIPALTITLAYSQMNDLFMLINDNGLVWSVFF